MALSLPWTLQTQVLDQARSGVVPIARTGSPRPGRAPLIPHLCQRAVRQRHRVAARHQSAATRGLLGPSQLSPARAPLGGRARGRAPRLAPPPQLPCTSPFAELFAPPGTEWTEQGRCPLPALVGRAGGRALVQRAPRAGMVPSPLSPTEGTWRRTGSRHRGPALRSVSQGWSALVPWSGFAGSSLAGPAHTCSPPSLASTAPPPGPGSTFTLGSRREGECPWAWLEGKGSQAAAASQVPGGTWSQPVIPSIIQGAPPLPSTPTREFPALCL